jgi:hypothetical protein
MTPIQQGSVNAPEHINKEDNKEKEEDVVMKNTVEEEEEKDPLQTNDPWKEEAEVKKSQEKKHWRYRTTQTKVNQRS